MKSKSTSKKNWSVLPRNWNDKNHLVCWQNDTIFLARKTCPSKKCYLNTSSASSWIQKCYTTIVSVVKTNFIHRWLHDEEILVRYLVTIRARTMPSQITGPPQSKYLACPKLSEGPQSRLRISPVGFRGPTAAGPPPGNFHLSSICAFSVSPSLSSFFLLQLLFFAQLRLFFIMCGTLPVFGIDIQYLGEPKHTFPNDLWRLRSAASDMAVAIRHMLDFIIARYFGLWGPAVLLDFFFYFRNFHFFNIFCQFNF